MSVRFSATTQPNRIKHPAGPEPGPGLALANCQLNAAARAVRTQVVPDVHLAGQRAHLDDGLSQEVVRLSRQFLPQLRLEVVVLVPDSHLDAVRRVVALAVGRRATQVRI